MGLPEGLVPVEPALVAGKPVSESPRLLGSKNGGLKLEVSQYVAVLEKQIIVLHEIVQHLKNEILK